MESGRHIGRSFRMHSAIHQATPSSVRLPSTFCPRRLLARTVRVMPRLQPLVNALSSWPESGAQEGIDGDTEDLCEVGYPINGDIVFAEFDGGNITLSGQTELREFGLRQAGGLTSVADILAEHDSRLRFAYGTIAARAFDASDSFCTFRCRFRFGGQKMSRTRVASARRGCFAHDALPPLRSPAVRGIPGSRVGDTDCCRAYDSRAQRHSKEWPGLKKEILVSGALPRLVRVGKVRVAARAPVPVPGADLSESEGDPRPSP